MAENHFPIRWPLPKSRGGTSGELTGATPVPSPRLLGDELRDNQASNDPLEIPRPRRKLTTQGKGRTGPPEKQGSLAIRSLKSPPLGPHLSRSKAGGEGRGSGTVPTPIICG